MCKPASRDHWNIQGCIAQRRTRPKRHLRSRRPGIGLWLSSRTGSLGSSTSRAADCPDLLLSDWNMPNTNGIELLEKITSAGINLKFGFVTSECTPEMRSRAAEAGAKFLIAKPFTATDFQDVLDREFGR